MMLRDILYCGAITLDIAGSLWGIYHHNPWGAGVCGFLVGALFITWRHA